MGVRVLLILHALRWTHVTCHMCTPPLPSYASRNPRDTTDIRRMCLASTFLNGIGENEAVIHKRTHANFFQTPPMSPQVDPPTYIWPTGRE